MLTSKQRSLLSSLANRMEPSAALGRDGLTEAVAAHLSRELELHELVKLRFSDFKASRDELAAQLAEKVGAELVRVIGNVAIIYRQNPDPQKRAIFFEGEARPARKAEDAESEEHRDRRMAAKGLRAPRGKVSTGKKPGYRKILALTRKPRRPRED